MQYEYMSNKVRINYTGFSPRYTQSDVLVEQLKQDKWETVLGFNSLSDDYAYTNARKFAQKLVEKLGKQEKVDNQVE